MWKPAIIVLGIAIFLLWSSSYFEDFEECDPMAVMFCAKVVYEWSSHRKELAESIKNPKKILNATDLYQRTADCISELNCKGAIPLKTNMEEMLTMMFHVNQENYECLQEFFKDIYITQFSNGKSCLKDFGFMEDNQIKRKAAYMIGKSCFLNHTLKTCSRNAQEFFNNYYDLFAHHVSTKPNNNECSGTYHHLQMLRCMALGMELGKRMPDNRMAKEDHSSVSFALRLCRDVQTCLDQSCLTTNSKRKVVAGACARLQILSSPEFRSLHDE